MLESKSAERIALLSKPNLLSIVWATITDLPAHSCSSSSSSDDSLAHSKSMDPPPPFQGCPWPRFVSSLLPFTAAEALRVRVVGARTDVEACIYFFCTGVGALWPVRDALRDFLVYPEAPRLLMRLLRPALQERDQRERSTGHGDVAGL
jgi:hypothetical protein